MSELSETKVEKLPLSCWECPIETCRLPISKVIKDKKLAEYSYRRHPKCPLKVIEQQEEEIDT